MPLRKTLRAPRCAMNPVPHHTPSYSPAQHEAVLTTGYSPLHTLPRQLSLDASASEDPDDPTAPLTFVWSCTPAPDALVPLPICPVLPADAPMLSFPEGTLLPGVYLFTVGVRHAAADASTAVTASVEVRVEAGALPIVSISQPDAAKQNANEKLRLEGFATDSDGDPVSVKRGVVHSAHGAWCDPFGQCADSHVGRMLQIDAHSLVGPPPQPSIKRH